MKAAIEFIEREGECIHARIEPVGPRQRDGVRCADCGAQFATRLSAHAAELTGVVICQHGVAIDATTPCFPCLAVTSTTLDGEAVAIDPRHAAGKKPWGEPIK